MDQMAQLRPIINLVGDYVENIDFEIWVTAYLFSGLIKCLEQFIGFDVFT